VLAHATSSATHERAFADVVRFLAEHDADMERRVTATADPAGRAHESEAFEVSSAQRQPPMITFGEHGGMILPVGLGIGATHDGQVTMSPDRAAGSMQIITFEEPIETMPGAPGTHDGSWHISVIVVTVAALRLLIITVCANAVCS
jgi:hypothetical protein